MAELLVRRVDKANVDAPELDAQCLKRGDVVVVCADGWTWGMEELANPDWLIIAVPDMDVDEASMFLTPERSLDGTESPFLRRRGFCLDLDASVFDRAGLRQAVDDPMTLTPAGTPDVQIVMSRIEDPVITTRPVAGASVFSVAVGIVELSREVVRYEKATAGAAVAAALAALPAVTTVGPVIRRSVAITLDAETVRAVQVQKRPLDDPQTFGVSPRVF